MAITDPFVLPEGIIFVPVVQLEPQLREHLTYSDDDYAISRARSRTTAKIVDAETAELLRSFEQPHTIVDAVLGFSRKKQVDPEKTLVDAYPMFEQFIRSGLLVPPGAETARRIQPSLAVGDPLDGNEVLGCVQVLEDSEVYQARFGGEVVALKIARPNAGALIRQMIAHEAAVLNQLNGNGAPRLLKMGEYSDRPYLAMNWCPGVSISEAAEDLRIADGRVTRDRVAQLCLALLDAYAALHSSGIIHADVHPRNVLVDRDGRITLIDFGLARADEAGLSEPTRAGVGFYFEPEYARAIREWGRVVRASATGEQFALAAMVYQLLTGATYIDFSVERDEMLRQISEELPQPFVQRGVDAWPEVERVLRRALSKRPEERYSSVAAFAKAFRASIAIDTDNTMKLSSRSCTTTPIAPDMLEDVLCLISPGGAWYESGLSKAPTASVNFGAAGIACALLHMACARGDPVLLGLADIWIGRAERVAMLPDAFFSPDEGLDPTTIGNVSTFHTTSGVACVRAQIANAMGDEYGQRAAIDSFLAASSVSCESLDLTLGRSGTLLAAASLLDGCLANQTRVREHLRTFGDNEVYGIWTQLDQQQPITGNSSIDNLGIAHGWGGMIYSSLRWCQVTGQVPPSTTTQRLHELANLAEPFGRGVRWPWLRRQPGQPGTYMAGWCNGNAGYVHLWVLAHKLTREKSFSALAEQTAWSVWEQSSASGNLCCGLAGQAYALLNFYHYSGDSDWLWRARELAARSANQMRSLLTHSGANMPLDLRPESLYKGVIGVVVLLNDLQSPARAYQPFFEREP